MSKHDTEQALKMFATARDIFIDRGLKIQEGFALLRIANALESEAHYETALASCFAAMKILNTKNDLFTTIELYETTGSLYASLNNPEKAKQYLYQAMQMADEGHDSNGRLSSRQKLSAVFRRFKQYDSALYYQDIYLSLHDEFFNTEKSRQLATLEKIYQTEKKDQLLELKNQEIQSQSVVITFISILVVALSVLGFIIFRYYRDKRKSNIALQKLNREVFERNEEILTQSEELTQANEEILRINELLSEESRKRAEKIEVQDKMLIDYAYSNAHNVRGPLARILGLAMLMRDEDDKALLKEYNTYLYVSAQELDKVITEINLKLQTK